MTRRRADERGSMSVELVFLTPVLVGCVLAMVGGFRMVEAKDQVSSTAHIAARAASLANDPASAATEGRRAARDALADRGQSCAELNVSVAGTVTPGGAIRVRVTCRADLSDVVGFGLPGSKTFSDEATVPIDSHRVVP